MPLYFNKKNQLFRRIKITQITVLFEHVVFLVVKCVSIEYEKFMNAPLL